MKIFLQTTKYKEIEIDYPFYAYYQEDDYEIFVKIDKDNFKKITIYLNGTIEIFKCSNNNYLADIWYRNKCDGNQWEEALMNVKTTINNL